jgi:arylformamidase
MSSSDARDERFDRRSALAALAGLAVASDAALAQSVPAPAAAPKGTLIWLDLDQQALDDAYDQIKYAANMRQVIQRYGTMSDYVRSRIGEPRRHSYGPTPVEHLDVYSAKAAKAPIHIFVHGGAWRVGDARGNAFCAEPFVRAGAHFVVIDFINVDKAGGSLLPMVEQVRRAIAWVHKNAATLGGDPDRIFLSGHSSGAHLAAAAITTDGTGDHAMPPGAVKGAVLVSGMYDLKPVRLSARSRYIKFTDEMEEVLSPERHLSRVTQPLVLAYGTLETPEFQRQTRDYFTALNKDPKLAVARAGKPHRLIVAEGYNHFEVIETMANPYGIVGSAALAQMGLG